MRKYSDEFKLTAVRLSQQPGLQVKTVAAALTIHPFMLSKWRKDARDGRLSGRAPKAPPPGPAREIAKLQALEKAHALLQEEHELLKNHLAPLAPPVAPETRSGYCLAPERRGRLLIGVVLSPSKNMVRGRFCGLASGDARRLRPIGDPV